MHAGLGRAVLEPAAGPPAGDSAYEADRLFLPVAGTQMEAFAPLRAGLTMSRFYHFLTDVVRAPQRSSQSPVLGRRGQGIGEVLAALAAGDAGSKSARARIDAYLSSIVPGVTGVEAREVGGFKTISLGTRFDGRTHEFGSEAMSEGTLRAVAILSALFQPDSLNGNLPLVGLEEPEIALHPAAAGVLFDALTEASGHVQVIATSQSSDLLDREDLGSAVIRPVAMRDGLTIAGEVDDASREIVRRKLFTLGELMRTGQISPQTAGEADPGE